MSEHPSAISGAFHRPFTEQVAFFRRKLGNLVPTQAWDDLLAAEHDHAFMVAGATKADLLADLAAAVDKAITEGRGIEEFRRDFRTIAKRHGWTGWTGEGSVKGEAWRVKTILSTNAYTSYAAGRMAQLKAGNFKYWIYQHGASKEPRPEHLDWDGLILPPDHKFWTIFYPPSDWGCSCYVVGAHSMAAAKLMGGKPEKVLRDGWDAIDPKTGVERGAGKGWNYAPGASVADEVAAMAAKIRHWDYQIAKAFMDALPDAQAERLARAYRDLPSTADDARRYAQRVENPKPDLPDLPPVRTLGRLDRDQIAEVARLKSGVDVKGFDFVLDADHISHAFAGHGAASGDVKPITPGDFGLLPRLLNGPIQMSAGKDPKLGNLPRIVIRSVVNGRIIETVWEVRRGRRSLYLVTMYEV